MSIPKIVQLGFAAGSVNSIALSQSPAAAPVTLNGALVSGGVAVLDAARPVIITSGGNDSTINYTVTGTDGTGAAVNQTLAGGNAAAVTTTQNFKTVTSVTHTGSVATTVQVGTTGAVQMPSSSPWIGLNINNDVMTPIGCSVSITGTINYTVEYTYELNPPTGSPVPYSISAGPLTAKTANAEAGNTFNFPVAALRLTANSATAPASARMIIIQQGPS